VCLNPRGVRGLDDVVLREEELGELHAAPVVVSDDLRKVVGRVGQLDDLPILEVALRDLEGDGAARP
jgi:hypothetical protein